MEISSGRITENWTPEQWHDRLEQMELAVETVEQFTTAITDGKYSTFAEVRLTSRRCCGRIADTFTNLCVSHGPVSTSSTKHTNRLASETSPYLLQHQHNPGQLVPVGDDVDVARRENKPIFLSVGYRAIRRTKYRENNE